MDFLQSKNWREFQRSVGREVFEVAGASIIKQTLPVIGDYLYIPRGPEKFSENIIDLAKKESVGWIRIETTDDKILEDIKKNINYKTEKAPHDMQPKETFMIDISKSEEMLLSEMKQKTRYNLNLAKKKDLKIIVSREKKYVDEFLRLVKITSERDGITAHPEEYYRKMVENIPAENLKLYLAQFENPASTREDASSTRGGKIIAANVVIFFEDTAIYLHGASDNEYRNVMAPYLLQWQQITDAKKAGCIRYDFGGIKTINSEQESGNSKNWEGITRFKLGFSPNTNPTKFSGCYDIILKPTKYKIYRIIQKTKALL